MLNDLTFGYFFVFGVPPLIIIIWVGVCTLRFYIKDTERANNKSPSSDDTTQGQIVAQSMKPKKAEDQPIVVTAHPVDPKKAEGSYDAVVVAQSMDPNEVAGPIHVAEIVVGSTP